LKFLPRGGSSAALCTDVIDGVVTTCCSRIARHDDDAGVGSCHYGRHLRSSLAYSCQSGGKHKARADAVRLDCRRSLRVRRLLEVRDGGKMRAPVGAAVCQWTIRMQPPVLLNRMAKTDGPAGKMMTRSKMREPLILAVCRVQSNTVLTLPSYSPSNYRARVRGAIRSSATGSEHGVVDHG